MATFGQRLKEMRENSTFTQMDIAELLGFKGVRSVQYIEADKQNLNQKQLGTLADYLNVSVDYLLGRVDDPQGHHYELPEDLHIWLQAGKKLSPDQRKSLLQTIETLIEK